MCHAGGESPSLANSEVLRENGVIGSPSLISPQMSCHLPTVKNHNSNSH